jgi:hypothetical protein
MLPKLHLLVLYIIYIKILNYMEQRPCGADNPTATPHFEEHGVCNNSHKASPLEPVLSQMKPAQTLSGSVPTNRVESSPIRL